MMSEEEKKTIETVENFIKYYKDNEQTGNRANLDILGEEVMAIEFILNKYDVQQKELERYKRLAEMNLKDSEEFKENMCKHRCILNNQIMELTEELNSLKEIEQLHQEENGKLRVELEQMKQKVEEYRIGWCNTGEELEQEKEKSKELNEALERSSGHVTQLTVENSELKYQLYHKQQMIDELTQNEENLKIELGKEKEKNKTKVDITDIEFSNFIKERYVSKDKIKELLENETIDISGFRCIAVEDIEKLLEV